MLPSIIASTSSSTMYMINKGMLQPAQQRHLRDALLLVGRVKLAMKLLQRFLFVLHQHGKHRAALVAALVQHVQRPDFDLLVHALELLAELAQLRRGGLILVRHLNDVERATAARVEATPGFSRRPRARMERRRVDFERAPPGHPENIIFHVRHRLHIQYTLNNTHHVVLKYQPYLAGP